MQYNVLRFNKLNRAFMTAHLVEVRLPRALHVRKGLLGQVGTRVLGDARV